MAQFMGVPGPSQDEFNALSGQVTALNGKILNRQNRTYVSTVSAFNEYCTNLSVGVGADVAATGDVMNDIVGINGFGIMSIVKVSNSGVHISYAIAFNQHVGSCVYNFTNSTTTNLNDLNGKISDIKAMTFTGVKNAGGNSPDNRDYGGILRLVGSAFSPTTGTDAYMVGVASDGSVYSGRQLNGASTITWKKLQVVNTGVFSIACSAGKNTITRTSTLNAGSLPTEDFSNCIFQVINHASSQNVSNTIEADGVNTLLVNSVSAQTLTFKWWYFT